jgi:hypothetical protein
MDILGPVIKEAKRKAREAASRNGSRNPAPSTTRPRQNHEINDKSC